MGSGRRNDVPERVTPGVHDVQQSDEFAGRGIAAERDRSERGDQRIGTEPSGAVVQRSGVCATAGVYVWVGVADGPGAQSGGNCELRFHGGEADVADGAIPA